MRSDVPEEGLSLETVFADSGKDIDTMNARLKKAAGEAGLPIGPRTMTYNSRPAHELGKWAESKGVGAAFHNAVFRAYFVAGNNIGNVPVLVELARSAGLSQQEAQSVIESRAFKDTVDSDWSRSIEVDPDYIPSIMMRGKLLVNPQTYDLFQQFMVQNNVKKRTSA